jgi:CelD/BcsL family acetyltransferase involved in cellulose biosynthesis
MTGSVVIESSGKGAVTSIRDEWRSLYAKSQCGPFLSWEWMATWFEHFCTGGTPFILKVVRENKVIAILPMVRDTASFLGVKTRRLFLAGDGAGGADHLDIICRPEDREDSFTAVFKFFSGIHCFDVIRLSNLASDSPAVHLDAGYDGCHVDVATTCPQLDLSGSWESILAGTKRATNFKRRLKQVENMAGFEYRSLTRPEEIRPAFERFLDLHQRRWESAGGSELSGHPRLVEFQRAVVRRMSEAGLVRFEELWLEGECRSSIYGLDNGLNFYYYSSGYDLNYANRSVGRVLLGLSVKNAVERGILLYDFLRGDESYKFDWANRSQAVINLTLSRKSMVVTASRRVEALMTRMKKAGKSALPASVTASLANRRRAWKRNLQLSGQ